MESFFLNIYTSIKICPLFHETHKIFFLQPSSFVCTDLFPPGTPFSRFMELYATPWMWGSKYYLYWAFHFSFHLEIMGCITLNPWSYIHNHV